MSVCPLALGLVPEDSLQDFDPDRREVKVDEKAKVQPPPVPDGAAVAATNFFGRLAVVAVCAEIKFWAPTPSTRRLLDGVEPGLHRVPTHWLISPQVAVARRHEPDAVLR